VCVCVFVASSGRELPDESVLDLDCYILQLPSKKEIERERERERGTEKREISLALTTSFTESSQLREIATGLEEEEEEEEGGEEEEEEDEVQSFSRERELVRSSRVSRQACLAADSREAGGFPRKRSSDGRK